MQKRQEPTFKLQTWNIPPEKINEWRRLQSTFPKEQATDCTINVLCFLGVIENPDSAEKLAKEKNRRGQGTDFYETLSHIFYHFNKGEYKINHVLLTPDDPYTEVIAALTHDNMYTLGWLERGPGVPGHSVIIARIKGELYILDPQQQSGYCGLDAIRQYLSDQGIVRIFYIYKSIGKPVRNRDSTTKQIRKKSSTDSPEYKRQKTSPKSSPKNLIPPPFNLNPVVFNLGANNLGANNLGANNLGAKKKTKKKRRGGSNKTAKRSRL